MENLRSQESRSFRSCRTCVIQSCRMESTKTGKYSEAYTIINKLLTWHKFCTRPLFSWSRRCTLWSYSIKAFAEINGILREIVNIADDTVNYAKCTIVSNRLHKKARVKTEDAVHRVYNKYMPSLLGDLFCILRRKKRKKKMVIVFFRSFYLFVLQNRNDSLKNNYRR